MLTICTTRFHTHKLYVLPTQYIYVFCVDLRTNSDYCAVRTGFFDVVQVNFKPRWAEGRGEPCSVLGCNHEGSGLQYDTAVATL